VRCELVEASLDDVYRIHLRLRDTQRKLTTALQAADPKLTALSGSVADIAVAVTGDPLDLARFPAGTSVSQDVKLFTIMVRVLTEASRPAGHASILREQPDGATRVDARSTALPERDAVCRGSPRA
jgi:hypothetical protein